MCVRACRSQCSSTESARCHPLNLYKQQNEHILYRLSREFPIHWSSGVQNCYFSVTIPNYYFLAVIRSFLSATRYPLLFSPAAVELEQMLQMTVITHRTTGDGEGARAL